MEPGRILVVDDDPRTLRSIARVLERGGHEVLCRMDAASAMELARSRAIDLALLDWILPDRSGLDIMAGLRACGLRCPVVIVSGVCGVEDKVVAFAAGADDYIQKPFDNRELLARVAAHLRRTRPLPREQTPLLGIDEPHRRVLVNGSHVALTRTQYQLLLHLWKRQDQFVSHASLASFLWPVDVPADPRHCVHVHVSELRARLGEAARAIHTVRGDGFMLSLTLAEDEEPRQ